MNFVTFMTSNWTQALRRWRDCSTALMGQKGMDKVSVLTELDLPKEWYDRFGKYIGEHAYAFWAWKPFIVRRELSLVPENGILVYMDGGCDIDPDRERFAGILRGVVGRMDDDGNDIALTNCEVPVSRICTSGLLNAMNVSEAHADTLGHWGANIMVMRKTPRISELVDEWNGFFFSHYEDAIGCRDYFHSEKPRLVNTGGDQSVLILLLDKLGIGITCTNDMMRRYVTRKRY